jgi:hypothetical protein
MTGWGSRIKQVLKRMETFKYANSKDLFGRHQSSVFEYEKEIRAPDIEFLIKLSRASGISIDWIATGQGQMISGLDHSKLHTAIKGTLNLVESARRNGREHAMDDIVAMVAGLYEDMIKTTVDTSNSYADSGDLPQSEEASSGHHRKTRS